MTTIPTSARSTDPAAPVDDQVLGHRQIPRRAVLAGSGAVLLACAACGAKSAAPSVTPATSAAAGASSATVALASVSDIPADSGLVVKGPDGQIVLARSAGKVVAHTAVCTHQGAIIDGAGVCPLHGSKFNVTTGAVLSGPAADPLAAVAVTEKDGKVYSA